MKLSVTIKPFSYFWLYSLKMYFSIFLMITDRLLEEYSIRINSFYVIHYIIAMCLTFFCNQPQNIPNIKFIIGFNREQQTLRKTLPFAAFTQDPHIYGGKDIKSGGTWLGLNVKTGLLVFLTNYDLPPPTVRMGRSRGQLVHRFLSTAFIPSGTNASQSDTIINEALSVVGREGLEYSPFNLTVYNIKSGNVFYICSEWGEKNPLKLETNKPYGICNCDILTIWPKTSHGTIMFKQLLSQMPEMKESEVFQKLGTIFRDGKRFSEIDDDQASIFVQPYWCKLQKAQRMTKSTFMMLAVEREGKIELQVKELTYSREGVAESTVQLSLNLQQN